MNKIKIVFLLSLLTVLVIFVGHLVGGKSGMLMALLLAVAINFISYWYSDKIVLTMYRARYLDQSTNIKVYQIVSELARQISLPIPKIYIIDDYTPNAFATGRNPQHAIIAITKGIIDLLSPRELRGVLAHELAHIKEHDILVSSIVATLAGAVMILVDLLHFGSIYSSIQNENEEENNNTPGLIELMAMSILAPVAAMLIQMAISRSREYLADYYAGIISADPEALARALSKLDQANRVHPMINVRLQTAHIFIVNPLNSQNFIGLFSTHPPISERIARLHKLANQITTIPWNDIPSVTIFDDLNFLSSSKFSSSCSDKYIDWS